MDNLPATRELLRKSIERIDEVERSAAERFERYEENMEARDRSNRRWRTLFAFVAAALVFAILVLAFQIRDYARAAREDRQDRIQNCRNGRAELQETMATVAEEIIKIARTTPNSQTPEAQARLDQYEVQLRGSFVAAVPKPEDCA